MRGRLPLSPLQPVPPAIDLHEDEEDLQRRVGVELSLPHHAKEQRRADNPDRELPQTALHPEDDAGQRDQRSGKFKRIDVQRRPRLSPVRTLPRTGPAGNRHGLERVHRLFPQFCASWPLT